MSRSKFLERNLNWFQLESSEFFYWCQIISDSWFLNKISLRSSMKNILWWYCQFSRPWTMIRHYSSFLAAFGEWKLCEKVQILELHKQIYCSYKTKRTVHYSIVMLKSFNELASDGPSLSGFLVVSKLYQRAPLSSGSWFQLINLFVWKSITRLYKFMLYKSKVILVPHSYVSLIPFYTSQAILNGIIWFQQLNKWLNQFLITPTL